MLTQRIAAHRRHQSSERQRAGAAHVLIAFMLFAFLVTSAMTIDFAYMQLVRTELRTATDAAAKAGAEALARTQDSNAAIAAAVAYGSQNRVAGRNFQLRNSDVSLGRVTGQANGSWSFTANATPFNSVRVNGKIANNALFGSVPTFFGPAFGQPGFATSQQATAGQQDVEVMLCLDRSGSMLFDMNGTDWSYPSNNPNLSTFTAWGTTWQYHLSPPHPTASRWAILANAVNIFLQEAGQFPNPPRAGLVTWGSAYTMPIAPSTFYPASTTDHALPSFTGFSWNSNVTSIQNAINTRTANPMMGGTNLSAGLDMAVAQFSGANSRPLSNKVVILLTDGQWNDGRDPLLAAADARAAGITVHVVSMLTSTQAVLQQVASTTGGHYYATQNEAELRNAFQELARTLPIVLVD
ncbi:MAG: VWA domain-containing protein [Planctomyces sp.]